MCALYARYTEAFGFSLKYRIEAFHWFCWYTISCIQQERTPQQFGDVCIVFKMLDRLTLITIYVHTTIAVQSNRYNFQLLYVYSDCYTHLIMLR